MTPDEKLIAAVKAGNTKKYDQLVRRHSQKIFALAKSILKNQEDAEEVTQDTFLKAFKALDGFRGESKFSSFLYRICYNESLNRLQTRKNTVEVKEDQVGEYEINDGFYQIKKADQKKYLSLSLDQLSAEQRMLLTLFYLEEQSYSEIMELTGLNLSSLKVKLFRARNALAKVLNQLMQGEARNLY